MCGDAGVAGLLVVAVGGVIGCANPDPDILAFIGDGTIGLKLSAVSIGCGVGDGGLSSSLMERLRN